jgi:hypothetical protein
MNYFTFFFLDRTLYILSFCHFWNQHENSVIDVGHTYKSFATKGKLGQVFGDLLVSHLSLNSMVLFFVVRYHSHRFHACSLTFITFSCIILSLMSEIGVIDQKTSHRSKILQWQKQTKDTRHNKHEAHSCSTWLDM